MLNCGRASWLGWGGTRIMSQSRKASRFLHPNGIPAYEDDFGAEAVYPSIDPVWNRHSEKNQMRHKEYLKWHEAIRKEPTVEGKSLQFCLPHRYGSYCFMLDEDIIQYDSLRFHQYISRTHLMSHFPAPYSEPALIEKVKHFAQLLKEPLLDVLRFELDGIERKRSEDEKSWEIGKRETESIVNQVSRLILQVLSLEESYFQQTQVDWKPKAEAFWMVGGFARSKLRKKRLANRLSMKYRNFLVKEEDPVELNFQFVGNPLVQIRSEFQIETLLESAPFLDTQPLSRFFYSPQDFYAYKKLRHPTNIAGHWSGDVAKCNILSFHSSHHLLRGEENRQRTAALQARTPQLILSQGVLVSFTKLLAQAYAQGFDQFGPLKQPLISQTIITDGRNWSFFAYQLNTLQLDKLTIDENTKMNWCWASPVLSILDSKGQLNNQVVDLLLQFHLLPALSERVRPPMPHIKSSLDQVSDDLERETIQYNVHRLYSQRGHHVDPYPQIMHWEKFYKIDNKTRPMDPRRRFFEIPGEKPYWEKYRIHDPRVQSKMLTKWQKELEAKKEEEKLEAVRAAQKAKFHQSDEEEEE